MTKPQMPTVDMLYNIKPFSGLEPKPEQKPELLSCNNHSGVDLYHKDDDSGRQKWEFKHLGGDVYNIVVYAGIDNGRSYLSCVKDGPDRGRVDMNLEDDGSGRQRWRLIPLANGSFHIQIAGGMDPDKKFLSCPPNGWCVDLHHVDDKSGRQQWLLIHEELRDVKVTLGKGETLESLPDFETWTIARNATSEEMEQTVKFDQKATITTSYQHERGYAFELSLEVGGKLGPAEVKASAKISGEDKQTQGQEVSKEDTRTYECKVKIPPYRQVKATASVAIKKVRYEYQVTGISKKTGKEVTGTGTLIKDSIGEIRYSAEEFTLDGKEPIKEIKAVPTK